MTTIDTHKLRQAFMELLVAVADHPDAMFQDGPLHAAFIKAADSARDFYPPTKELTGDIRSGSILIE